MTATAVETGTTLPRDLLPSSADLKDVLALLGAQDVAENIVTLSNTRNSVLWHASGADRSVALRCYLRKDISLRDILYEHAVMRYAAHSIDFVQPALRDSRGCPYVRHKERYFSAFPYTPGDVGYVKGDIAAQASQILADFHRSMIGFLPRNNAPATDSPGVLETCARSFHRCLVEGTLRDAAPWQELIRICDRASFRFASLPTTLRRGTVHGNFHVGNLVTQGKTVIGLIDFKYAHQSERLFDLAALAENFVRRDFGSSLNWTRINELLTLYERRFNLIDADEASLELMIVRSNACRIMNLVRWKCADIAELRSHLALPVSRLLAANVA
jgi:Ser/Thr protein kinase RdoA (MazF antagonist)